MTIGSGAAGWEGRADLSQATLSTYGAVAFSEPVARRFGVTCLHLLLIYKDATDSEVNHEDPDGTLIEVPDDKGQVASKPFGECSGRRRRWPTSIARR